LRLTDQLYSATGLAGAAGEGLQDFPRQRSEGSKSVRGRFAENPASIRLRRIGKRGAMGPRVNRRRLFHKLHCQQTRRKFFSKQLPSPNGAANSQCYLSRRYVLRDCSPFKVRCHPLKIKEVSRPVASGRIRLTDLVVAIARQRRALLFSPLQRDFAFL